MNSNKKFVIMLEIFVITFLVMSVVPICGLSDFSSPEVRQKGFNFYAVYDRLADTESLEGYICCVAMSGDGKKLIFSTTTDTFLYTVNADGSDLTSIPLPADIIGIGGVAIDYDGSRAFFMARDAGWIHLIYKVEGGVATQILDTYDHSEIGRCTGIETTADGEYVYFREDQGKDVWRIRHGGGTPEKVIEDTEVPREEGSQSHGRNVKKDFAISADGSTIAFVLYGYVDPTDGYRSKEELFVLDGDGYRQLTNDDKNVYKSYFDISGDGTTIVFWASVPQNKWYSIRSDGSAKIALEAGSGGDLALNYDGTRMFYTDSAAKGGRLVNTDGSGSIGLFPSWNVGAITIAATYDLCISDDGRRVSFRYISGGGPLYVGYHNDPEAVPDSPTIHNIVFDPPAMPRGDPDARVIVTSQISDPQGLADIERTSIDELVDGRLETSSYVPVYFYLGYYGGTRDEGDWPDETAGDGIFSSACKPGVKIDELDQMTVRMGAMDASKTVVVADKVLSIGGVIPTPTPTLTPTPSTTPTETPTSTKPPIKQKSAKTTPTTTPAETPTLTVECPPGFKWVRMSGVGCVQKDCLAIEHAKLSYTGACICEDGYKACYESVDYTNFDTSKCFPNCPGVRLVACVKPGEPCPGEEEEETEFDYPDLVILNAEFGESSDDIGVLVLSVRVANRGNAGASETQVYAWDPESGWLSKYSSVPALLPGEDEWVGIELAIPEEQRGLTHTFRVEVDPEEMVTELNEGNNIEWTRGIVIPPLAEPTPSPTATQEGEEPDPVLLILIVVAIATLGCITLTIRHYTITQHHKKWQDEAKEEEPPEHCQYCTHHCRKIELEFDPAMRKIAYLRLGAYDPVHSEQIKDGQVTGEIVDGLNKVVSARHRRVNAEKLQELVTPQAHALLQQIMGLLREELSPRDVSLSGHLEGGKVTCQFILYHCKRRGNVNIWEEEAKWEATIKDERDELVGILHSIDPAELGIPEQVAPDLTRLLMQFIEKV